jgi:hypothetical protein
MATPTETTQITSNIPDWAKGYAERLLGESEKLSRRGFQPYQGQMVEEFNPLQEQAFRDVAGMRTASQIGQATGLAGLAGLRAEKAGEYSPMADTQFYSSPLQQPGGIQSYMSPYMQGVVEQQKSQAIQDYGRQLPGMAAAAARAGAKGGTREALMQSEAQRNLQNQLGGIQATGLQNAFQQAQAQAAQDAAMRAQYGLAGSQLREQSRQFGAGLGLSGLQQQLDAARTLGGLGQQQYGQQMGINQAQLGAGSQIQALGQQDLASRYQQFLNEQQLPFQQLGFFSDILRGTPSSAAIQQRYQAPPSLGGIVGGLGLAGLGGLLGGFGGS